ncbi:alpha-L-fucosidase [Loigolactobacillus jiayinensis]|uniref:alpha-L-fucosidase n=1 Tax=Loigolactobacillus jiayinensis TaxID=2486016 RepID=A0ABW1R9F2_9LACO|nr:alpha-L-fucosidase [Loigolactobacillus jiayinensis]
MITSLKRVKQYEDLGLGLFLHWGLYSQLGVGEWSEFIHGRNKAEYEQLIHTFTATKFDAKSLVRAAKNMGAKYIVLTTKHHEGFFLYDTKGLSDFDVMHSPANRDLIQEFVVACHEESIQPFFYMATYDWHSPLYTKNFKKYLSYLKESVELLCRNYGQIGGFWFDGNWNKKDANWHLDELYQTIRTYQPEAIIVNNTGLKNRGKISNPEIDVVTYERNTPSAINHGLSGEKYVAGEISLTMNQHWGYAKNDLSFKSPREIIENIAHARQVGANILINVGLTGEGSIPSINHNYMNLIGQWTKMAAPALYKPKPTKNLKTDNRYRDFAVVDKNNIYLFIFDLKIVGNKNVVLGGEGNNLRSFTGINKKIKQITWLDNSKTLNFMQDVSEKLLTIDASGFMYGTDWVVRIARITF